MLRRILSRITYRLAQGVLLLTLFFGLLGSLTLLASLVFKWDPTFRLDKNTTLSLPSYAKGIYVPASASVSLPDSNFMAHYKNAWSEQFPNTTVFHGDKYDHNARNRNVNDTLVYADTIVTSFIDLFDTTRPKVTAASITGMKFTVQPKSMGQAIVFALPSLLSGLLLAWCCWHLFLMLREIRRGQSFGENNLKRVLKIGYALVIVQLTYMFLHHFPPFDSSMFVQFESSIPNFRMPFHLGGSPESPFSAEWLIGGCIILVFANAFRQGKEIQEENKLTV